MNILIVIHAYGEGVTGGAETHARLIAEQFVAHGHRVDVATSTSRSYVSWASEFAPGESELGGVRVLRFPTRKARDEKIFPPLAPRVIIGRRPMPKLLQKEWARLQGPDVTELDVFLTQHAQDYDVIIASTYLYEPTHMALMNAPGRTSVILQSHAHEEPYLELPMFHELFAMADGYAFNTPEEQEVVQKRFRFDRPASVVGIGAELKRTADPDRFRKQFGLGDDPYLLFVGRVDPSKGSEELYDYFLEFRERFSSDLKLVIMGEQIRELPNHDAVVKTGYVDEQTKQDALAGAFVLAVPSYFESFSMVLTEAWVHNVPAIVQGHCEVLVGQCRRSTGGLAYANFAEFSEALKLLLGNRELRDQLGRNGRRYTEENYDWDVVIGRYIELFEEAKVSARRPFQLLNSSND